MRFDKVEDLNLYFILSKTTYYCRNGCSRDLGMVTLVTSLPDRVNVADKIMEMMEKYAANLEDVVKEQTQQLMSEKQKIDRLLYRLLPA